jgi:hypothetical protein
MFLPIPALLATPVRRDDRDGHSPHPHGAAGPPVHHAQIEIEGVKCEAETGETEQRPDGDFNEDTRPGAPRIPPRVPVPSRCQRVAVSPVAGAGASSRTKVAVVSVALVPAR